MLKQKLETVRKPTSRKRIMTRSRIKTEVEELKEKNVEITKGNQRLKEKVFDLEGKLSDSEERRQATLEILTKGWKEKDELLQQNKKLKRKV